MMGDDESGGGGGGSCELLFRMEGIVFCLCGVHAGR